MTPQTRTRSRRRWRLPLLLITLISGGWLIYAWLHPTLRPVTVRTLPAGTQFLFSVHGAGYPAIQAVPIKAFDPTNPPNPCALHWLDDRGHPHRVQFERSWYTEHLFWLEDSISPLCKVVLQDDTGQDVLHWRDGHSQTVMVDRLQRAWMPNDAGFFWKDERLYSPQGNTVELPTTGTNHADQIRVYSADPRYVVLPKGDYKVVVFDLQARSIVTTQPLLTYMPGMLFHHGNRFLLVSINGAARVVEHGKVIYSTPTSPYPWRWSDDGTIWQVHKNVARVLRWREGPCRLTALPWAINRDTRVKAWFGEYGNRSSFSNFGGLDIPSASQSPALSLAVWNDGRLVARTDTIRVMHQSTARKLQYYALKLHLRGTITSEARQLTLYRDGNVVGRYQVPVDNIVLETPSLLSHLSAASRVAISGTTLSYNTDKGYCSVDYFGGCHEHLAFTADGRYLSWIIYAGKEVRHFVFAIR